MSKYLVLPFTHTHLFYFMMYSLCTIPAFIGFIMMYRYHEWIFDIISEVFFIGVSIVMFNVIHPFFKLKNETKEEVT